MTRLRAKISGAVGALALIAVAVPAGVSFAGTERVPAASSRAATSQADSFLGGRPQVPAALAPPAGHAVHAVLKATGVQIYGCTAGAWTLVEPAASLTGVTLRPAKRVTALHYRGPRWQSNQDGSLVEGDGASAVRAPSARPGSIPQLRITARSTRGDGVFGAVTYIQRLDTVGGVAPAGSCSGGDTTAVPYRAVYRFFVSRR